MQQRTGREMNISGPRYRCIDRKLRIYSCVRANTITHTHTHVIVFQRPGVPEAEGFLMEKHDSESFNLDFASSHLPSLLCLSLSSSLPHSPAPLPLSLSLSLPPSPHLFSVTRGLAGDEPMSAEDAGESGRHRGKGR